MKHLIEKVFRKILKFTYGFDNWHVAPLHERPYAVDVIAYCNRLSTRNSFAEIGCGLGDITRNVYYSERTGYDMDPRVLRAARILPAAGGGKPDFLEFTFPTSQLSIQTDILTMVNWIHHIEPAILKTKIESYFHHNISPGGRIIIDTVQDTAYRYNHNIKHLTTDLTCKVEKLGEYARQREVWAIIKPV